MELLERLWDAGYAADALHTVLTGRLPGCAAKPKKDETEAFEELQYAGELMLVQFFSLVRSGLGVKRKG